ncbi:MAG TPA: ATP-binding protein, partial [Candidatus Wallbacteria bacterium]|nr:ATP-binding protein [Candidatus Wallbacteria bacterium]
EKRYIRSNGKYESGARINACDFPIYFNAIHDRQNVVADDIRTDPHVTELVADYCKPLGITSMLDSPIWLRGKVIGIFSMEHVGYRRKWTDDEISFSNIASDAVSIALETSERAAAERIKLESERKYKILFDNSPVGIMYADEKGRIMNINNALTAILGLDGANKLKNEGVCVFQPFVSPGFSRKFEECSASLKEDSGEFEYLLSDDENRFLKYHIKPIKETDGQISIQVVIEDITGKKHMENEMAKVSKLESLGILAGGIAHDFNNYLAAIVGNISYAKLMKGGQDSALCEILDKAESISFDAKNLALQLLTFSKGNRPVKKVFYINDLIRETVDFVLRGTNIDYTWKPVENVWPIEADEGQIKQAITNIVVNAVQVMPGGGSISIIIENIEISANDESGLKAGNFVEISISDTGSGINPKNIMKIFDPYYTTKSHGSGLGLAVVFSIIKNHEGRVFAESDGVSGTTFRILLPALPESKPERIASSNTGIKLNLSGKILLMDDEDEIRSITGQLLTHYGFNVETAHNGEEAIELYV